MQRSTHHPRRALLKKYQMEPVRSFFRRMPCPFETSTSFWGTSLLSGTKRNSRLNLYSSLPQPWIWPFFLQIIWVPSREEWSLETKIWVWVCSRLRLWHCLDSIFFSADRARIYIYVCTYPDTYVRLKKSHELVLFLVLIQWHEKHPSFPSFCICSCFS